MANIRFNGGDDVIVPVVIEAQGVPVDLSTGTLTVQVWAHNLKLFDADFEQLNAQPDEGEPHGNVLISEEQSAALPHGAVAYLKAVFNRTVGDVTVSTVPMVLERVL